LEQTRLKREQRSSDGLGVALWLPPGVNSDDGPLEAVIAESIAAL
jgi:hypothetical protein